MNSEHVRRLMAMQDDSIEEPEGESTFAPVSARDELEAAIMEQLGQIMSLLLRKNAAYGNSCFEPLRIFSKADAVEQLRVRLDDKLSRIQRGNGSGDEDTILDICGYLILLRIASK